VCLKDPGVTRAYLYTILAVILWTVGPLGSKAALLATGAGSGLRPLEVAFWAIAVGWVALLALLIARNRLGLLGDIAARGWLVLAAMGLFGWAGYPVAMNYAYMRLPLPDVMVISYLNPVFVTLLQGAAFGAVVRFVSGWERRPERVGERRLSIVVAGLALCLLGVAVIATQGRLSALGGVKSVAGAAAALFAGFAWGVYSNLGRFVALRPSRPGRQMGDVHNFAAMTMGLAAMGAGLALSGRLENPSGYTAAVYLGAVGPARVSAWLIVAAMGLLNYGAGYTLWLDALEEGTQVGEGHKLPPLTYGTLLLAVVGGWVVLHEPFGAGFWQGALLIAGGNALNMWGRLPGRRRVPAHEAAEEAEAPDVV